MTWQSSKFTAREYLRRLDLPPDIRGLRINLADYETDEDLRFIKGVGEWPLAYHRMVNRAIARELRKRGGVVEFVTIRMSDYFDWLAGGKFENTAANRARFIVEKIH